MPRNATKAADNVFYLARKAAEKCNDHLGSGKELNAVKLNRKQITAVLELAGVLLATVLAFRLGVAAARAERGYDAYGGEYLLLLLPALYYTGKQTLQDWIADLREIRRDDSPWRKED